MAGYVKISNTSDNIKTILNSSDASNGEIKGYFPLLEKTINTTNKLVQGGELTQEEEKLVDITPKNERGLISNVNNLLSQVVNINEKINSSVIALALIDCGDALDSIND